MPPATRRSALKTLSATALSLSLPPLPEAGVAPRAQATPFVLRQAEARFTEHYHLLGFDLYLKISGKDTDGQLSVYTGDYHRHDGPPLHVHYQQDEAFYITEGEFLVQVGAARHTLRAGDLVFLPRNIPHAFLVLSETGRMVFMTQPSGTTEALFQQLAQLPPTATPADFQRVHLAHAMRVVGPKLTAG